MMTWGVLDVIGDLALIGFSIKGKVIATKPGHTHNTNFAKKIIDLGFTDKDIVEMKSKELLLEYKLWRKETGQ